MSDNDKVPAGGNYDVLRVRLDQGITELKDSLEKLNEVRKQTFGAIEQKLVATERINTANNCIPRDMIALGNHLLFGFNVHMGLKAVMEVSDVFSVYSYKEHSFQEAGLSFISDPQFEDDFHKLYKYYKDTVFVKFAQRGPYLYMIFRIGKDVSDIKAFKWQITPEKLEYIDNRSDHEFVYPPQHDFKWKKTTRDDQRTGKYPHISIEDKLFVETVQGDLTIKIEDNTESGHGIYQEEVEDKDQTLDDSEIYYAIYGSLILLKIKPYKEEHFRYIVYNSKLQQARNIPALKDAGIFLPDDQGILFPNGYYLQSGDYKIYEKGESSLLYESTIASPNGEDYLYVFYQPVTGNYLMLSFNIIQRQMSTPVWCHGYALFANGEMAYFNADEVPKKHHVVRIWQTSFTGPDFELPHIENSYLAKIGNKDIVRAMAECQEIITLSEKGEQYDGLYIDLSRQTTDIIDSYYWLTHKEVFEIQKPLEKIRETAKAAIDEFEKVVRIRKDTKDQTEKTFTAVTSHIGMTSRESTHSLENFVRNLMLFRKLIGEVEGLRQLRYSDEEEIDQRLTQLREANEKYAAACVRFLLRPEALSPYSDAIKKLDTQIEEVSKVAEAKEIEEAINKTGKDLELLIEIVGNLKIDDATQTTEIIENISSLFALINQHRARLKKHAQNLSLQEARAEFTVQMKLIDQGLTNYLDLADTPEKCEEFMAKLLVQVEDLETKLGEFEEFLEAISEKREMVLDAFESRKNILNEALGRKRQTLLQSGKRILHSIENRVMKMKDQSEIQSYFSADLMVEKIRTTIAQLRELNDPVKADDLAGRLKSLKEDAFRQLRDREDLFSEGDNIIKLGAFQFSVNSQALELSIVPREERLFFHLGGTNFYEEVHDPVLLENKILWDQLLQSESNDVYRSEYLAFELLQKARKGGHEGYESFLALSVEELLAHIRQEMSGRFNEGYVKGIHDEDTLKILDALRTFQKEGESFLYSARIRALAIRYWLFHLSEERRVELNDRYKGLGLIYSVFKNPGIFAEACNSLMPVLQETMTVSLADAAQAAAYLVEEISRSSLFPLSKEAGALKDQFMTSLKERKALKTYKDSLLKAGDREIDQFTMVYEWLKVFSHKEEKAYLEEATLSLIAEDHFRMSEISLNITLQGLKGTHLRISSDSTLTLNFNDYFERVRDFVNQQVPAYKSLQSRKQEIVRTFSDDLRLDTFKPRVMSSFVRNKLINDVYLPLIGANLAKQIGEAGVNQRTDLMGLLLLISPPGYGKTTLMEYISNRLGLIFMKINGPSIGHAVTSVDPAEAKSATARQELEKLNLAFEMGDNVMIYLDDIQHVNPEFLQKFISLCDAQRKIEGVYKGKTKTYDFRGKKVCVVMAGNPYTESGDKFNIPDMLANRADIYNLGDIIGSTEKEFKLSYLENCITSNQTLNNLASKSQNDIYQLIAAAEKGETSVSGQLEGNHSVDEIGDYLSVFGKLLKVRDVIMRVNGEYVASAAQADEYRTEPSFKLQGSYRDMNKLAEKVFPVMNEQELLTLLLDHYENEAQSLTTGAEANLLKFKLITNRLSAEEEERWKYICEIFMKQQKRKGYGESANGMITENLEDITEGIKDIARALRK